MDWHVSEALLQQFISGTAGQEENRRIVRHLLHGCRQCWGLVSLTWMGKGAEEADYELAFAEARRFATELEEQLAIEKLRGWAQWSALEPLDPAARIAIVRSQPAYQTLGLYERLLEAAKWYQRRDPVEAVDVVQLALVVAEHIPSLSGTKRADLRATTWAHLSNAYRLASNFDSAREAINFAWKIYEEESSQDGVDRALIISLEASYLNDMGEFEAAEANLEGALQVYRLLQDEHSQGRTLIQMGDIIGHVQPERGIQLLRRGLALISPVVEPRLELCAQHDLAWFTCELGKPEDALGILERARPLYGLYPDSQTQLRLHWLEGRIVFRLGQLEEARHVFARVWDEFQVRDFKQEMVLVAIDFAEVLALQGDVREAARLVRQVHAIMANWQIHLDALAAWLYFWRLLEGGRAHDIFSKLRLYYQRHWHRAETFEETEY